MNDDQNQNSQVSNPPIDAGVACRLRGLAEDIAAFVALQNTRLERVIGTSSHGHESQRDFDRRQSELDARERELEQRERDALEHVEDECQKLTAAWDQLEVQQRQLLAHGSGPGPSAPVQATPQPVAAGTAFPGGDIDLIGDIAMPARNSATVQPWSREPAAEQFQQMKREIRRHARRRKT